MQRDPVPQHKSSDGNLASHLASEYAAESHLLASLAQLVRLLARQGADEWMHAAARHTALAIPGGQLGTERPSERVVPKAKPGALP